MLAEVLEKPRCQDEETWSLFHVRLEDEQGNLEDEEGKFHMILTRKTFQEQPDRFLVDCTAVQIHSKSSCNQGFGMST